MAARSKARLRAVEVLYESDLLGTPVADALESLQARSQHPPNPYTVEIVNGVSENLERIDELLSTYAQGWTLDRMPGVDRAILRVGCWELLYSEVPDGVVLAEAVQIADALSTDESGRYLNGLLSRIQAVKGRLSS